MHKPYRQGIDFFMTAEDEAFCLKGFSQFGPLGFMPYWITDMNHPYEKDLSEASKQSSLLYILNLDLANQIDYRRVEARNTHVIRAMNSDCIEFQRSRFVKHRPNWLDQGHFWYSRVTEKPENDYQLEWKSEAFIDWASKCFKWVKKNFKRIPDGNKRHITYGCYIGADALAKLKTAEIIVSSNPLKQEYIRSLVQDL